MKINLDKILEKTTFSVFEDVQKFPLDSFRNRQSRLGINLNAIKYQLDKLVRMELIKRINGKYATEITV